MKLKLILLMCLVLTGCSTAPTYLVEDGKTLVVGRILYSATGWKDAINIDMNVSADQQIDMVIDPAGSISSNVRTGPGGLFFFLADANTSYKVVKLMYKKKGERGSWRSIYQGTNMRIRSGESGVSNVGTIKWVIEGENGGFERKADTEGEIEDYFKSKYPDNVWVDEVWSREF